MKADQHGVTTADLLEIIASGWNGVECVDLSFHLEQAAKELRDQNDEIVRLREALRWYADQMCEFGPHYEGCGKMTDDDCAGCKARAALAQHEAEGRTDD